MQTLSPLYEDIYLLCEKMFNDAVSSKKQIHLRSFYNAYRALHKFNKWFDSLVKGDFERLFKEKYFNEQITIEKSEHKHYWETSVIFIRGDHITTHLLLKLCKLRYVSDICDECDFLMEHYMEKENYRWIAKYGHVCGKFDEVSMILRRNALVIREDALIKEEVEYDFEKNRIQLSEASKTMVQNMIALENRMSLHLCTHARIEDIIF